MKPSAAILFAARLHRQRSPLLRWAVHLGIFGMAPVSFVDASLFPLPLPGSTDLLLLLLVTNGANPFLNAGVGAAASILGAYSTWLAGKRGGEAALNRYVPERIRRQVMPRVERFGAPSMAVAALLPPPIPLMPFLLAGGVLGVGRNRFLLAFGLARTARYALVVWLGATYGRRVIRAWEQYLAGWSEVILWAYVGLLAAAALYGYLRWRRERQRHAAGQHAAA